MRTAVVLLGAGLLTGCSPGSKATTTPTPALPARPHSSATLTVVAPDPGSIISGSKVHIRLKLNGARVVPLASTRIAPDEGLIHLKLDGRLVAISYGLEQEIAVVKGRHLIEAEFVAADHFSFDPRVIAAVSFTVK